MQHIHGSGGDPAAHADIMIALAARISPYVDQDIECGTPLKSLCKVLVVDDSGPIQILSDSPLLCPLLCVYICVCL